MADHTARVRWQISEGEDFASNRYSRAHTWSFDGGLSVPGSAAPGYLPAALIDESAVDPEEALLASAASCHMLYFLAYAAKAGFTMTSYEDNPEGKVEKNETGDPWVSAIAMRPRAVFTGDKRPTSEEIEQLHHRAHKSCIIANSLKSALTIEPIIES
ncbi:OsmC family protein [Croceicoccus marinus]|jgi:organic hydroperoxide reductase OsmC/OhrA|uniref:OsmC family protein n=1 Tax=Croceicoccus marinus TaxID=450378 RepID=A0A7G6VT73_9SPHN|nr:OsmC family protein [Croceicoccus marinus]QNE04938.1 OsmC family protein [Croceicoccus marinus]